MIKGKLVGLRAIEKEDLMMLKNWRNNPDFRKNFREIRELNQDNQEIWFNKMVVNSSNDFMFTIVRLEDDAPIGACGLLYVNWIIRSADFSFYIGHKEEYVNDKGYSEDAARVLIEYGFNNLNLNKIWMELYEFDQKKIKFFIEKFNFQKDAILRENCFEGGRYWNSFIVSLLRSDYKKTV